MLIFIKYILPLCFILLVIWSVSSAIKRLRNGKSIQADQQTHAGPRQVVFRLFGAGILIAALLAVYLQNN